MIRLQTLIQAWNRFFFEPISPLPMAVYRILLGLIVLSKQLLLAPDVSVWFGSRGVLSFEVARRVSGGAGFNLFTWLPHNDATVWGVFLLSCFCALTLAFGLFTRLSAAGLFLLLVTLDHRNPLILNGGDTFLRIAVFFTIFSAGGKALSLDRWLASRQRPAPVLPEKYAPWAMRLIQIQVAFLYLYAFVWKVGGTMWMGGTAIYYTSRLMEFWRFPMPYVFEHMWTIKLWSWFTLIIESALGTLVWIKELRYTVLLGGVLLHLGIDYTMNIPLFAFIMISAYVTFVEPDDLERFFAATRSWLRNRNSIPREAQPSQDHPSQPAPSGR